MAKMNIKRNFQDSVKKDALIDYAMAAAVPVYTAFAPSIFKMKGWLGFAVAYGLPILAGMAFKQRAMTIAGVAMAAGHIAYEYGDTMFEDGIWSLNDNPALVGVGEVPMYSEYSLPPGAYPAQVGSDTVIAYPELNDGLGEYIVNPEDVDFMDDNFMTFESDDLVDISSRF